MIKVRSYENENDFVLMQNLIRENYLKSEEQLYPSPADLEYWRIFTMIRPTVCGGPDCGLMMTIFWLWPE